MRDTVSGFIRGSQEASAIYFDKSNAQGINASLLDLQVGLKLGCWAVYIYISYTSCIADGIIKNMYIMYIYIYQYNIFAYQHN